MLKSIFKRKKINFRMNSKGHKQLDEVKKSIKAIKEEFNKESKNLMKIQTEILEIKNTAS